eukprot:7985378-Pyramimonas_sp.AAC.1
MPDLRGGLLHLPRVRGPHRAGSRGAGRAPGGALADGRRPRSGREEGVAGLCRASFSRRCQAFVGDPREAQARPLAGLRVARAPPRRLDALSCSVRPHFPLREQASQVRSAWNG